MKARKNNLILGLISIAFSGFAFAVDAPVNLEVKKVPTVTVPTAPTAKQAVVASKPVVLNANTEIAPSKVVKPSQKESVDESVNFKTTSIKAGTGSSTVTLAKPAPAIPSEQSSVVPSEQTGKKTLVPNNRKSDVLPGVRSSVDTNKPIVIDSRIGINEMVQLSNKMPNRIVTSFIDPEIIDESNMDVIPSGNALYVSPRGNEPIGIFIQERGKPNLGAISLTIVPRDIPGATLIINLRDVNTKAEPEEKISSDYSANLKYIFRQLGKNKTPEGYSKAPMTGIRATLGPITATSKFKYSGGYNDIFAYDLINVASERVTLSEQSFYQKDVKAVAFFPKIQLMPGERTTVFIMAGKSDSDSDGGEQ